MSNLPSPLPHQVNLNNFFEHLNECYFQLFGFYPEDPQESNYQILSHYLKKYSEFYAKRCLKADKELILSDHK